MRFWRVDNPEFAMNLIPWFVPTNQNPLQMSWRLHEMLRLSPDDTFCVLALEKGIIQAMLIAYKEKRHVWLWQAHARKGFGYAKYIFEGLLHWTCFVGRKKIRMGTTENFRAYQRRWGFKVCRWDKSMMELII